jgi:protein SCO1
MNARLDPRAGAPGFLWSLLVAFALVLLFASGCDTARGETLEREPAAAAAPRPAEHGASADHPHAGGLEAGEHTDHSIFHLESSWWDQHGERRELASLGGRVQVVSMVYTYCAHTCPQILVDMKRIEAALEAGEWEGVGFVLVSVDPERDTPGRLRHFAESTRLDPTRWTLLGGSDGDVLELAMLLGVRFRRESATDFSHSNVLLVLDPAGEIVFRQVGLGADPAPLLAAIRALPR